MIRSVIDHIVAGPPAPGNRISFVRLDGTESYDLAELYKMSGEVACGLRELGIGPGDRIGILAANCLEWVLLDLAALRLKAVTAGFEPGKFAHGPDLASRYDLRALFTDRPNDVAGPAVRSCRNLPRSVVMGVPGCIVAKNHPAAHREGGVGQVLPGKKVIVRPIEERLKAAAAIEDCVVFCPAQTRLVAVVSPSGEPADRGAIEEHVARSNVLLGRDEQISKVVIARPRFSVGNGLLTSQFKPRRSQILERFRSEITA